MCVNQNEKESPFLVAKQPIISLPKVSYSVQTRVASLWRAHSVSERNAESRDSARSMMPSYSLARCKHAAHNMPPPSSKIGLQSSTDHSHQIDATARQKKKQQTKTSQNTILSVMSHTLSPIPKRYAPPERTRYNHLAAGFAEHVFAGFLELFED